MLQTSWKTWFLSPIMRQFSDYLHSAESGKTEKNADQHVKQLSRIAAKITPNPGPDPDFVCVLDEATLLRVWLEPFRHSGVKPGTIESYLCSMNSFCHFLIHQHLEHGPRAMAVQQAIKRWRRGLAKQRKIRHMAIQVEALDNLINPEDIGTFMESTAAQNTKKLLAEPIGRPLTRRELLDCRNLLINRLIQANGQRNGAIANMTMGEVEAAARSTSGCVITVLQHKNAALGPATIALNQELTIMLDTFLIYRDRCENIGPDMRTAASQLFFSIHRNGMARGLCASTLNAALQAFWKKSGVSKKITCNAVRKATATHVRDSGAVPGPLARHMTHQVRTQDTYYLIHDQRKQAHAVAGIIENVMLSTSATSSSTLPLTIDEPTVRTEEPMAIEESAVNQPLLALEEGPESIAIRQEREEQLERQILSHGRRAFTKKDGDDLLQLFTTYNGPLMQKSVILFMRETDEGRAMLVRLSYLGVNFQKKIVDKLRSHQRSSARKAANSV